MSAEQPFQTKPVTSTETIEKVAGVPSVKDDRLPSDFPGTGGSEIKPEGIAITGEQAPAAGQTTYTGEGTGVGTTDTGVGATGSGTGTGDEGIIRGGSSDLPGDKPSAKEKVAGKLEELTGKVTGDEAKVAEGQAKKEGLNVPVFGSAGLEGASTTR